MCSTFNTLNIYTRFYQNNLLEQFVKRRQVELYYTEMELCDLLESLILAGKTLHSNNLVHGDFRAHNILIDQEGAYKIIDANALGLK